MGAYQYQALKKRGTTAKGVIEADSERHARQLLRERNLIPIDVKALKELHPALHKNKLSSEALALFTRCLLMPDEWLFLLEL